MKIKKKCCRCGVWIAGKPFFRYPHVFDKPSNSVYDAIWSKILYFDESCVRIFDKNNEEMRSKYMYINNEKLIKFYEQYEVKL